MIVAIASAIVVWPKSSATISAIRVMTMRYRAMRPRLIVLAGRFCDEFKRAG